MAQAAEKKEDHVNEFVVGSPNGYYEPNVERIDTTDIVELRLDQDLIGRLRVDAEIESNVSLLADSIFSDGMEVVSCVGDEDDTDFAQAQEIADFVKMACESRRPLIFVAKEMFKGAFYNGVKVAEIVLKFRSDSRVDGKLVLDRINPKPNSATAFVTDKFFNVLGLVGARDSGSVAPAGVASLKSEEIIPREKFFILDFEREDNDPRAMSQLRAVVDDYCDKQLTRVQWREWRRTSAIPKKFATTAEKASAVQVTNPNGTPVVENGVQKKISPQRALLNALERFSNDSAIVAEFGTKVEQLEVNGTGVQFERHFKSCNISIRKVILGDSLATGEADKDARAARESSKDVVDIRKQTFRTMVADAIERDIFRLLTVVNFGEDKAHLTPKCFLGDTEANDWAGDLTAASGAGYTFAPEHFAALDTQFGLEPRAETEVIEPADGEEKPATGSEKEKEQPAKEKDQEAGTKTK